VNIQLPPKGSAKEEIITITGLEADALAAKDAILKASGADSCVCVLPPPTCVQCYTFTTWVMVPVELQFLGKFEDGLNNCFSGLGVFFVLFFLHLNPESLCFS
jgi:hypothetical protein